VPSLDGRFRVQSAMQGPKDRVDNSQLQGFPSAMDEEIEDPGASMIEGNHELDDHALQVNAPVHSLFWPHFLSISCQKMSWEMLILHSVNLMLTILVAV
jgi:hypothetical protein